MFNKTIKIMKKVLFAAIAMMFVAFESFAQTEQGTFSVQPTAGLTIAKTNGSGAKAKAGFIGGAEFAYQVSNVVGISAGAMFSMEGAKTDHDGKWKANYLNIPILANVYVWDALAVKAGIQPGFNLSSKMDGVDFKDATKSTNFSIPVGVSYEFGQFVVDARYNIGVSELSDLGDAKGRVFQVTVGYRIPLNR